MKRLAFVVQLPKYVSPGQRFRFEQFEPMLREAGWQIDTFSFLDEDTYRILYHPGNTVQKALGVVKGFLRRIAFLFKARRYDYIFLQREAAPVGPPVFEWILAKVLRVRIIHDFDDAIWVPNTSGDNKLASSIKCFWKIPKIVKWSYKVSVGNDFLKRFALQYNPRVERIPTVVDMETRYTPMKQHGSHLPVIGWTGSHSTLKYLELILPILKELSTTHQFRFLVIADRKPELDIPHLDFCKWNAETEINDLLRMDVGVMPLVADAWSEGKCGFKLIQYLSLGIPAVASPVGVNSVIIEEGMNGYLCQSPEQWLAALRALLDDAALRARLGAAGKQKMLREYSLASVKKDFLNLFTQ